MTVWWVGKGTHRFVTPLCPGTYLLTPDRRHTLYQWTEGCIVHPCEMCYYICVTGLVPQRCDMHLPDEEVVAIAVTAIVGTWHGIEGPAWMQTIGISQLSVMIGILYVRLDLRHSSYCRLQSSMSTNKGFYRT